MNDDRSKLRRRAFLQGAAALAAAAISLRKLRGQTRPAAEEAAGLGAEDAHAPTMRDGRPALRVLLREADDSPLDDERMKTLHGRDLANDPLPQAIVTASGRARIELHRDEPIQLSCRLNVPDFGEVYCYADNNGRGYTRAENIDFVSHAAETRLRRVTEAFEKLRPSGLVVPGEFQKHFIAAQHFATDMNPTRYAYTRLASALHAGEILALAAARHRIARLAAPRNDFYFGVMISGYKTPDPAYEKLVKGLFNFATTCWYTWKEEEPFEKRIDYARMDESNQWCWQRRITPKGFGYLYMTPGAVPEWMRPSATSATTRSISNPRWPLDRVRDNYLRVIEQTMRRYHGKLHYAEIMNEAHDKANLWRLNHEQILDWAKGAMDAARRGSATVKRQMNHCCLWAEYARKKNEDGARRWSPYRFIKDCFDAGVDYEVIGLQSYYPQQDLFEIDRMLDRFAAFNKPLHITEMSTASRDGLDPASMRPTTAAPGWHGPWSESMQADWAESIYTLCYSKPSFQCVGWWDFVDTPGHFWPHGGLLHADLKPKEAYFRLKKLQGDWGLRIGG